MLFADIDADGCIVIREFDPISQHERITDILANPYWTEGEKFIVEWQFRLLGDFKTALIDAIKLADEGNLDRLELGFPDEVQGFRAWAYGDLGQRLRDAGLEL